MRAGQPGSHSEEGTASPARHRACPQLLSEATGACILWVGPKLGKPTWGTNQNNGWGWGGCERGRLLGEHMVTGVWLPQSMRLPGFRETFT